MAPIQITDAQQPSLDEVLVTAEANAVESVTTRDVIEELDRGRRRVDRH